MKEYSLEIFQKTRWTFVLMKSGKIIYRSKKEGLRPLLFCLKNKKALLKNAIVYDKIVGRAAACLMIWGKAKSVMTPTISRSALKELKKNKIAVEYKNITGKIMNRAGNDLCPMEKLSKGKSAREFSIILLDKQACSQQATDNIRDRKSVV